MYKIVNVNAKIFRGYDIRGEVGIDLDENVFYTLGRGYANFLSQRRINLSTVGFDNRISSENFCKAFIKGLNDGGVDTIELGLCLSPIVYFSNYHFLTKGSVMITASHNPKEYNGLKLGVGYSDTMVTEDLQQFRKIIGSKNFVKGKGVNIIKDIFKDYKKEILKFFKLKRKWKIVIDTCNSTPGKFYPKMLREAGCIVYEQNTKLDGNFPLGVPDPTEVHVLERLARGVIQYKADLGLAYDSDGDRMAIVDEKGQVLWMDTIVAIFVKDILEYMKGAPIVYNTLCSRQVTETIETMGGIDVMWKTGHSFLKAKLKEERSPFCGELSGHIFFMDNFYGHDDAIYATLRLLAFLERKKQNLSQAVLELPKYIGSPEIKLGLADDIKFELIDKKINLDFKKLWPKGKFREFDGIRVDTKTEMAIIRASQNGPYITIKFEAKTRKEYEKLKQVIKNILLKYKEIDWTKGVNLEAFD